jgi:predicted permease
MPLLPRASSFFRNLFAATTVERELDQELESYVDLLTEEMVRDGVEPEEARRRALIELGGKESVKVSVRERRIGFGFDTFAQDIHYGVRMLRKSPGFTFIAVLTLALGIGTSTAVFSVVHGVLLRTLPYPNPDRLVYIWTDSKNGKKPFSPPDFVEFREQTTSFEDVAAIVGRALVTLSADGRPEQVQVRDVTPNLLSVYGVSPYLGRAFVPEDEDVIRFEDWGNPDVELPTGVVMLSYEFWRDRFGEDPNALGKLVRFDSHPYRIIGVTPPQFRPLIPADGDYTMAVDAWGLARMDFPRMPRDVSFLRMVGRLKPGVTIEQAQAEATHFAQRQRERFLIHRETGYQLEVVSLHTSVTEAHSASIWVLFGAVGFVLLIACANLANLLLARSAGRQKELAVRMALGACRSRLVRQLLTESVLLSLLGAGVGLLLTDWLVGLFITLSPDSLPRMEEIRIDGNVLAFTLAASALAAVLIGLLAALRFSQPHVTAALQSAGRESIGLGPQRWHGLLVVGEVALSVILVIGMALLLQSLVTLLKVNPGFRADHVLTGELNVSGRRYPRYPRPDARVRFVREVTERISQLPGVEDVGFALVIPLSRQDAGHTYATEAMAATDRVFPPAKYRPVTPGYFRAVGTRLLAGRRFTWADLDGEKLVSIVDEKLAQKAWPGESPVGRRLRVEVWSTSTGQIHLEPLWTEVVGVAENVRSAHLGQVDLETVYLPYNLYAHSELSVLVRSSSEPSVLTELVREQIGQVDSEMAVANVRLMEDFVSDSVAPQQFSLTLLSAFGLSGLTLALIGLYGVLSGSVSLRLREISIRLALGALPRDVLRLVMSRGVGLIGAGLGLGLLGAYGLTRLLESQLYQVSPTELSVYAGVAALTVVVSLAACYLPARRATKVDPMVILRGE